MEIEFRILDFIQTYIRTNIGDVLMPFCSWIGNHSAIWIILATCLLLYPKTRKAGAIIITALLVDAILCNEVLKPLVGRVRPCDINTSIRLLITRPRGFSFPSSHTTAAFAVVAGLFFAGEKRLSRIVFVFALVIAFSRLYLYVHFPTDVVAGMIVGLLEGILAWRMVEFALFHARKKLRK